VSYVKYFNQIIKLHPNLLTIKAKTSFTATFSKISKAKKLDLVVLQKPKSRQMSAVILTRILGKKFLWIQHWQNPPVPNFVSKILVAQADKIIASSYNEAEKLKSFGINRYKIKILKKKNFKSRAVKVTKSHPKLNSIQNNPRSQVLFVNSRRNNKLSNRFNKN